MNARLHVSGGALGGGRMVEDASSVAGAFIGASTLEPCLSMSMFIFHLVRKVAGIPDCISIILLLSKYEKVNHLYTMKFC